MRSESRKAVPQGDHYAYPVCQFFADRVLPGLAEVLPEIGLDHPCAALAFLITPDDRLDQLSPLDALRGADHRLKELTVRIAGVTAAEASDSSRVPIPGKLVCLLSVPLASQTGH